jgi:hypothetical protein
MRHIDQNLGTTSVAFYQKIFAAYNAAPGANAVSSGGFGGDGCNGFADPDDLHGPGHEHVPCARHFSTARGLPSSDTLTSGRMDWSASTSDRVFLQVQYDRGRNPFYLDPVSPLFDAEGSQRSWQGQLFETHSFGSSVASQFLLAGTYVAPIFKLVHGSEALSAFPATLNFSGSEFTGLAGFNSNLAFPAGRPTTQYQVSEDLVKIRGKQKFGIGVNFERIYWTNLGYTQDAAGTLVPQTLDAFYQGGVDPGTPNADFTELTQSFASQTSQRIAFYNLALYGQDEWHARLT